MAQIPKGRFVKGAYKPICRDCAIYFAITVRVFISGKSRLVDILFHLARKKITSICLENVRFHICVCPSLF